MEVIDAMRRAYEIARRSPDKSTQNGAVLLNHHGEVVGEGINDWPQGFRPEPKHHERPLKYDFVNHAEWSAVTGVDYMEAGTLVCPFLACSICARIIVASGCRHIVGHLPRIRAATPHWAEEIAKGDLIMDCAGVEREYITQAIPLDEPILADRKEWWGV